LGNDVQSLSIVKIMKIFDAHFHIVNSEFPLIENNGFLPSPFTIEDYKTRLEEIEVVGGAVVSGSFQGFDQGYLINALQKLGNHFCGVANIPFDLSDAELNRLNNAGISAVRFNLKRGGSEKVEHLNYLSNKLYNEFGWHTELYIDSKDIEDLISTLDKLPSFSIDHLGLSKSGIGNLLKLVEKGTQIKATGFGRLDFDPLPVMREIYGINPEALMFGTDLPSTRAKTPFSDDDIRLVTNNFSNEEQENLFYKNAMRWYGKYSLT